MNIKHFSFLIIAFSLCSVSCVKKQRADIEHELNSLKQAAYEYNIAFVKEKRKVHELHKVITQTIDSISSSKIEDSFATYQNQYSINLDSNLYKEGDLLSKAIAIRSQEILSYVKKLTAFSHVMLIDRSGRVYSFPELDPAFVSPSSKDLNAYYSNSVLDTHLVDYGAWYEHLQIEPFKGSWVHTCVRTIHHDGEVLGWIVADISLESVTQLLSDFESKHLVLLNNRGAVFYTGEEAAAVAEIPLKYPVYSPGYSFNEANLNREFSVFNTRLDQARIAFHSILQNGDSKVEVKTSFSKFILLATEVKETNCVLVRVVEI